MITNKKGFSMVELLAVVAILGILSTIGIVAVSNILEKAHEEYYKNQEKNLVLAAQSYMSANQNELPKVVGRKETITAKELKEANYLKKDVTRYDGKTKCNDEKTYVNVFKYGTTDYSYTAYLTCPDDKIADEEVKKEQPFIDAVFPGTSEDVATASIKITIKGEKNNAETKLLSYSYSLYVIENGKSVELLNTGTMQVRQPTVEKTISLSKYALSSSYVSLKVKATATNIKGNSVSQTFTNDYRDKTAPKCEYPNKEDDPKSPFRRKTWVNRDVKVTIKCNDGNGSGCEKETYTKTFTTDGGVDHIKISDNVGNQQSCPVVKFIDKSAPTVKVNVYKCDSSYNGTGSVLKSYTASGNTVEVKSSDLTGNVNGWLNKANYPHGVCFAFNVEDASSLKSKSWKWNNTGIKKNASNYTTLNGGSSEETFTTDDGYNLTTKKVYTHSLSGDGHRYGEFVIKDGIGNTSTIKFNILIDKTSPTAQVTAGRCANRDATACQNATSVTSSQTVTADNSNTSRSMSFDTWVSKGIQIKYSVTDLSDVKRTWKYDDPRSMTSRPSANKDGSPSTGTSGTLTLTGTGQRNSVITFTDEAGNTSQVTVQGYIANTCTLTYHANYGTFNSNASNTVEKQDYDSYFGAADTGLRNATGGSGTYYNATRQYHSTIANKQWNTSTTYNAGTIYDETKRYKAQSVCSGMTDGTDKTADFYVNWRTHECTVTFSANGGSIKTNGDGTTQIVKAGKNLGTKPTVSRDYYHVDNGDAWKKGSTTNYVAADATKKGEELCDLTTGDNSVTLNANWKQNVCTIKYDPNGGKFNKNASNTTDTLTQGQILGSYENGVKNARGSGGTFYATKTDNVVASWAEWNLQANGKGKALDQDIWYTQEEICPQLKTQANPTVTLYVKWLSQEPTLRIYIWDHISGEDKCDQYKDSKKDYTGQKNKKDRPYRKYKYASYKCKCKYKTTNSELDSVKALYLKHTSHKANGVDCSKAPKEYQACSKEERNECFPENAYIFYKFGDEGRASCHNKQNYKVGDTKRDWKINEYVYLVCTNGDVYNNTSAGYKWFHGAYWYWNTGSYSAALSYALINDKQIRADIDNLDQYNVEFDDRSDMVSQDSVVGNKTKIKGICYDYCEMKYGDERYGDEEVTFIDDYEDD